MGLDLCPRTLSDMPLSAWTPPAAARPPRPAHRSPHHLALPRVTCGVLAGRVQAGMRHPSMEEDHRVRAQGYAHGPSYQGGVKTLNLLQLWRS